MHVHLQRHIFLARIVCDGVYVWTQRLCLHSWSVCKDKRCVSRELTFDPFASAVTVRLNRHQHFFILYPNNEILQNSSSYILLNEMFKDFKKEEQILQMWKKQDILKRSSRN